MGGRDVWAEGMCEWRGCRCGDFKLEGVCVDEDSGYMWVVEKGVCLGYKSVEGWKGGIYGRLRKEIKIYVD